MAKLSERQRGKLIKKITTNCSCQTANVYDEEDVDVLNEFSDKKLIALAKQKQEHEQSEAVINALRGALDDEDEELSLTDLEAVLTNAKDDEEEDEEEDEADEEDEDEEEMTKKAKKGKKGKVPPAFLKNKKGKKPTTNAIDDDDEEDEDEEPQVNARKKPVTTKEWLKNAPPEVRNVVQNAMGVELKQRRKLIGDLVANIEDDEERQKEAKFYERMPTDTLVRLHNNHVSDSGEPTANASFVYPFGGIPHPALMQSYEGAAGVFGNNSSRASSDEDSEEDLLQPITMNMFDAKGNLKTAEKPAKKRA